MPVQERNCGSCISFITEGVRSLVPRPEGQQAGKCTRWGITTFQNWNYETALRNNNREQVIYLMWQNNQTCYEPNPNIQTNPPKTQTPQLHPYSSRPYSGERLEDFLDRTGGTLSEILERRRRGLL